jgi:hypothetical protein
MSKYVFIYTDPEHPLDEENVFLSLPYKSIADFKLKNPDFSIVMTYKLDDLLDKLLKSEDNKIKRLQKKIEKLKSKTGYTSTFAYSKCNNCGHIDAD